MALLLMARCGILMTISLAISFIGTASAFTLSPSLLPSPLHTHTHSSAAASVHPFRPPLLRLRPPLPPLRAAQEDQLILTEENVEKTLEACRQELSALFGNSEENRSVGITGDVEFAGLDGPLVILRLKGRFWHSRATVLERVTAFLLNRIPECLGVEIEDPAMLDDNAE